ncbi:hypothetical protein B0T18DRAFT_331830 [Schizothecium vesticola]|uniref:Uncharacterized protein n=1 Tax=Schizothecium vesticola TaxID=314040 RepID=A0AA40JZ15_9PEZI|nr:hypothetical protein B0T18DRAFT_331830 [Schizothecium vesticola]
MKPPPRVTTLPVALGHTLQLVLLLDSVRVAAALGSVDQLLSEALGNRLDVAERRLAGTGCEEGDGLVDAAEGRHIDGLSADGTGRADTGAVFAGTAVDDSVNGNLDGVLVGHQVDLQLRVRNDANGHELLAVVAAVHHQRVGEALNDGAVGLAETLGGIAAGGVGDVDGGANLDVVAVQRCFVSYAPGQTGYVFAGFDVRLSDLECWRSCGRWVLTSGRCRGSRHHRSSSGL